MTPAPAWLRAAWAVRLLAADPAGLKGIWLRARAGPVRARFLQMLSLATAPLLTRRIHPAIGDEALFGGIDVAATLAAGRRVRSPGILAQLPSLLLLPMAERTPPGLAGRLAGMLDGDLGHVLVALDEGASEEEGLPAALAERLAFHLDLDGLPIAACPWIDPHALVVEPSTVALEPERLAVETAAAFGIGSLRAPGLTLLAARAIAGPAAASTAGAPPISSAALELAAALVLAPRARQLPATEPDAAEQADPEPEETPPADVDRDDRDMLDTPPGPPDPPQELVLEAVRAALPPGLLEALAARPVGSAPPKAQSPSGGSQGGQQRRGNRRGRPLPSRPGRLEDGARLDLVATLRQAAPWQGLRRRGDATGPLQIRRDDLRIRRFEQRSDRALIFAVDASGSAALARLAEAKGAIELLLGEAYARRDHVALIAFRGTGAELLLPPTRSLVQTKRRLAALPGGGGTPLADALRVALDTARQARGRGMTPALALLTDGRANIRLDGSAGRAEAMEEARRVARAVRAAGLPVLLIDTAVRPQSAAKALAADLSARYLPLPGADARRLSGAVTAALDLPL
ncbi:MAG: magnesium chelatase subunit D [Pseudomonadota bacterium]